MRKLVRPTKPMSGLEGVETSLSSRTESRNKHEEINLGAKAPHSSRVASRLRNDDTIQPKRTRVTKSNQLNKQSNGNSFIRSHDPKMGNSQAIVDELHMLETTIKPVNTAQNTNT